MKNLLTVVQTLAVSTLVAILVASATVYILSPKISEQIDSVERKAVTQYQKVTDSFQEIDNALSERIDYSLQDQLRKDKYHCIVTYNSIASLESIPSISII